MAAGSSVLVGLASEVEADLEQLQGRWVSVAGRRQAELLIAGNLFTFRFLDGDIYIGSLDLDVDDRPKMMQMRIEEGPARHRGKTALCIYELADDSLRWCPTEPGSDERLAVFPRLDNTRYLCTIFRRDRRQKA